MSTVPSLPQHDSVAEQAERQKELADARKKYVYEHDSRIAPLPTVVSVPKEANFRPVWVVGVIAAVTPLLANVLAEGSRLFSNGAATESAAEHGMTESEVHGAERAFAALVAHNTALAAHHAELSSPPLPQAPQAPAPEDMATQHHGIRGLVDRVEDAVEGVVQKVLHPLKTLESMVEAALRELEELLKTVLSEAFRLLLRYLGLYGIAPNMQAFDDLFRLLALPPLAAGWDDDLQFARLRVAGPNPLMIQRLTAPDARFPVTDAMWKAVFGDTDSFDAALAEGRAYLADYKDLDGAPNGSTPVQKYSAAPLALFGVPRSGAADRALRAVAIQCGQTPGHSTPIFTPKDGGAWRAAKLCVQVADGNMHELVAHLGTTHLVLQPFSIATPRNLPPQHPLNVLLSPHLVGTLPINQAAVSTLIAPGGPVDKLLASTIEFDGGLAVRSVQTYDFTKHLPTNFFKAQGTDDVEALPQYPYRDDALLVWAAIREWASAYLAIYYNSDDDVQNDKELQSWRAELASPAGGTLSQLPELQTFDALVNLTAWVIFTGSAQHAAVNFPQNDIMSYAPNLPLAAYQPPPVGPVANPEQASLRALPPLQQAVLQQAVGMVLGGVHYTRLGQYELTHRGPYFADPRARAQADVFRRRLREVQAAIGQANLTRPSYIPLIPGRIPQSINI